MLAACTPQDATDVAAPAPAPAMSCTPARQQLRGELFGALEGDLVARPEASACSGQERPVGGGVRLRFRAEQTPQLPEVLVILGIDELTPGRTESGLRTTITIIDETQQRFFSTADQSNCFADISEHAVIADQRRSLVAGSAWCLTAIPSVAGDESVRIRDWQFAGLIEWRAL